MSKEKSYCITFIGPQGSGKGTQAQILSQLLDIPVLGTGVIFRQEIAEKTHLGERISGFLKAGKLVPDFLTREVVKKHLMEIGFEKSFILDGFPRDSVQAKTLLRWVKLTHIFHIQITDEEVMKRISGRQMCMHGHVFHALYRPPKKENICDECGLPLFTRDDDTVEAVKKRLLIYHKETEPLIQYFTEKNEPLFCINGMQTIEGVSKDIKQYL